MLGHIDSLYRYPVKGLSPERLDSVALDIGQTFPHDRAYAIENGPGRFDPEAPKFLPKTNFLMLMRNERLATLRTRFDPTTERLTIERGGRAVAHGDLGTPTGRRIIEQFMAAFMKEELRGAPRLVSAPGHSFADCGEPVIHIVNLASVRDLERSIGKPVDPLRFRANLYLDGFPAWSELNWAGRTLAIGDAARIRILRRTVRCDATNVDPVTGARDLGIPRAIERLHGHADFGIYGTVTEATAHAVPLRPGQPVSLT